MELPGRTNKEARKRNFPSILFTMLQSMELEGRTDIVSWRPHGRAFQVHKMSDFEEHVLPRYDRTTTFSQSCSILFHFYNALLHPLSFSGFFDTETLFRFNVS